MRRPLGKQAYSRGAALALIAALLAPACAKKPDDGTAPKLASSELPPLDLRDDTSNLMLTWIDPKGETHVELHPADVPESARPLVRAMASDRTDGTRELFYVADLTQKGPNGAYAVRTMPRREWEAAIEKRRADYLAKTAPPPAAVPTPGSPSSAQQPPGRGSAQGVTVIIYGASWCKPCHQAADYVRSKGGTAILKDIEEDPTAAAEMREKLSKSHQHGGSIPVIDVRGQILVGFSPSALDQALSQATGGATL